MFGPGSEVWVGRTVIAGVDGVGTATGSVGEAVRLPSLIVQLAKKNRLATEKINFIHISLSLMLDRFI